ncbi:MAG: hypothetical protein ACRD43_12940 [Pyrinomonadaceae bacterium]
MVEKLTVIFFIILCLLLGFYLMLLPWVSFGMIGDWGDNYLLAFLVDKLGLPMIRDAIASTWFRGAITGLGVVNLLVAFWEVGHFNESVAMLRGKPGENKTNEKS